MKYLLFATLSLLLVACGTNGKKKDNMKNKASEGDIKRQEALAEASAKFYNLRAETLEGDPFVFSSLKGKRVLIVNTASECGYTPQYQQLQELFEAYSTEGFTIIGFPSNDFGQQEPGSNAEIKTFCEKNYGVNFLMMTKTQVMGSNQHPVYQWLTQKSQNAKADNSVSWNFNKFLINEEGRLIAYYPSNVSPLDDAILDFAKGSSAK